MTQTKQQIIAGTFRGGVQSQRLTPGTFRGGVQSQRLTPGTFRGGVQSQRLTPGTFRGIASTAACGTCQDAGCGTCSGRCHSSQARFNHLMPGALVDHSARAMPARLELSDK